MNTFIFDLDGTLLPMDQEEFFKNYFKSLAKELAPYGYEPEMLVTSIWTGTQAMLANDGSISNENRFWNTFSSIHGEESRSSIPIFEKFYEEEFDKLKEFTMPSDLAKECVLTLKEKGYNLILATNPLFPKIATHTRIKWAGIKPEDFSYITTYENSSFSKPNLNYYKEILLKTGKLPEECMMVGNDMKEDMVISELGVDTYLLMDCAINFEEEKAGGLKKGSFKDLMLMIEDLPKLK